MDGWVREHLKAEGTAQGPVTMGYYKREDLPFYYALADAFTICDRYHCSVIGPTDPNQLYSRRRALDPDGQRAARCWRPRDEPRIGSRQLSWTTMPEQLGRAGSAGRSTRATDVSTIERPAASRCSASTRPTRR